MNQESAPQCETISLAEWQRLSENYQLPYKDGFPDWSLLDDTDATRDENGRSDRERMIEQWYDLYFQQG